ncbi:MAG: UvrD-helicase domain-containing protein, partial [Rickettsiales bacterium]|nr:UvrD-helicase domain-containing protein [Rickettsiales bacterium]
MTGKISLSAEQAAAVRPTFSIVVQANAGTGKTFVLVQRLLRLLFREYSAAPEGAARPGILCLTYTNAGASEMRIRVLDAIMEWARADDESLRGLLTGIAHENQPSNQDLMNARRIFYDFLDSPGRLKIVTIHGFCEEVLRRFAPESGVPAAWRLLSGAEQKRVLKDAFKDLMNRPGTDAMAAAFDNIVGQTSEYSLDGLLESILKQYQNISVLKRSFKFPDYVIEKTKKQLGLTVEPLRPDDYENREKYLTKTGEIRRNLKKCPPELIENAIKIHEYDQWVKNSAILSSSSDFLILCGAFADRYEAIKNRRGLLDFDDLLLRTKFLFEDPARMGAVLSQMDYDIKHILVDESQDNSKIMWDIILPMLDGFFDARAGALPRTFFAVGDAKQSIFSFQGASPSQFAEIPQKISKASVSGSRQYATVPLSESRRTTRAVLDVVDFFFANAGIRSFPENVSHKCWRKTDFGMACIHPLYEKTDGESLEKTRGKYVDMVAGKIEKLVLEEKIPPSDIMVLLQRRNPFSGLLQSALRRRNIPAAGSDRINLPSYQPVRDLLNILRFALAPHDPQNDAALAFVLRGPVFRLSERQMQDLCVTRRRDRPLSAEVAEQMPGTYAELMRMAGASARGPYEFFSLILRQYKTRFIAAAGRAALEPLDEFMTMALSYGRTESGGLPGFLRWFLDGDAEVRRDMEKGSGVRILTAHSSKGLEAPVVFLIDTARNPSSATRHNPFEALAPADGFFLCKTPGFDSDACALAAAADLDQKTEEYWRLLYVAMTRARDRLLVFGCEEARGGASDSWHSKLYETVKEMPGAAISDYGVITISSGENHAEKLAKNIETPASTDLTNQLKKLRNSKCAESGAENFVPAAKWHESGLGLSHGIDIHKKLQFLDLDLEDELAKKIKGDRAVSRFFAPGAMTEVPIAGTVAGEFRSMRIDRMIEAGDEILFMDYKTDDG